MIPPRWGDYPFHSSIFRLFNSVFQHLLPPLRGYCDVAPLGLLNHEGNKKRSVSFEYTPSAVVSCSNHDLSRGLSSRLLHSRRCVYTTDVCTPRLKSWFVEESLLNA